MVALAGMNEAGLNAKLPWKLYGDGRFFHVAEDVEEKNSLGAGLSEC